MKEILENFFTNTDKNVFALINMPEVLKGTLFSRYSRSSKDLRQLFLDEFLQNEEHDFNAIVNKSKEQLLAIKKAEDFYERVLIQFGDDSVDELGGAHIAMENISNLATKFFEDARIGISPLEKSSRYVYFNKKENNKYRYYRGIELLEESFGDAYLETMDFLFDTYSDLMEPMKEYFMSLYPKSDDISDRAYKSTIKAKTCDTIRGLLPASTLTNLGIYGNGRAFEYLIIKSRASKLKEIQHLGKEMHTELSKIMPSFVKRAFNRHGDAFYEFLKSIKTDFIAKKSKSKKNVFLSYYDKNAIDKIVEKIVFINSFMSLEEAKDYCKNLSLDAKKEIIKKYIGKRTNRRHKPLRAFENTYYCFEIFGNFGAYRDLQRHRMLTQERQLLSCNFSYDMPKEITDAGYEKEFREAMKRAKELYEKIASKDKYLAQYAVPFAYKLRWYFTFNLREAFHLLELRTIKQGHPDYRKICQDIYKEIEKVHPFLASLMNYVDLNNYSLERIDAEKRIDEKLKKIGTQS